MASCGSFAQLFFSLGLLLAASSPGLAGKVRVYYIGIVEEIWDYSPNVTNEITGQPITADSPGADSILRGPDRIGSVYKKALYRKFTDETFETRAEQPEWLGFVGPMIYAEVGDNVTLHVKNMATMEYSAHPHGFFYLKDSEGAVYEDGTTQKADERIAPGTTYTYLWIANERAGPAEDGPNCVPWMYHSHVESTYDTNAGLTGFILICREGILDDTNQRTDVDKDFVLMFTVTDENLSYYLEDNIATYTTDPNLDPEDEDFVASNLMSSVNGYLYGALPGLEVCLGDTVEWHILVIGTEIDIHTVNFHGNPVAMRNHRIDTVALTPAAMATATMVATNPGTWLVKSHVVTHGQAGAQALYTVDSSCGDGLNPSPLSGITREYFISAEERAWDYAPTHLNNMTGKSLTDANGPAYQFFTGEDNRIPGTYTKTSYVQYTDSTFLQMVPQDAPEEVHLGLLGPVIRAEVGDTISVTFKNMALEPYSIHPRGVMYDKDNEGMEYNDGTTMSQKNDGYVMPWFTYVYTWTVPQAFGPTALDDACITFTYSSAVDEARDMYTGLVGPLLICKQGSLSADTGKQTTCDREFILLFLIFDENLSWNLNSSIQTYAPNADPSDEDFIASNKMTSINGYSFANLAGLVMTVGQKVCWHVLALGKETDQHTVYFHQLTFDLEGRRVDSAPLFPGTSQSFVTIPDNPGTWLLECETNTHFTQGMTALYTVEEDNAVTKAPLMGNISTYYIAAIEVEWDYTPDMYDPVRSQMLTDEDSPGNVFVTRGEATIGSRYRKALFREYDDETFVRRVKRTTDEDVSLGLLGPVMRVEVGDTLRVVFRNLAYRNYSIHAQNLFATKSNEGSIYGDSMTSDAPVQPGETRTYTWTVPANRGPTENDRACIPSVYYSGVNRVADTNSGLVGVLDICRPGTLNAARRRKDVDKEFNLFFSVTDENKSNYFRENIQHYCTKPEMVDESDPDFQESNLMHGINGFLYNNLHRLEMTKGERVAWNLIGLGDEVDLHSIHFHGQTLTYKTEHVNRLDVSELLPGTFVNLEMIPDDPGVWLLHCHVNDHILAGMETFFTVHEASTVPAQGCQYRRPSRPEVRPPRRGTF